MKKVRLKDLKGEENPLKTVAIITRIILDLARKCGMSKEEAIEIRDKIFLKIWKVNLEAKPHEDCVKEIHKFIKIHNRVKRKKKIVFNDELIPMK